MSSWKAMPLADLVQPVETWNPSSSPPDEVFDYIDLSAVDQNTKLIVGARKLLCGEAPSRARQLVAKGDVLVSTVRPNLNAVALVPENLDGATASTGFCVLRAKGNLLDPGYLFQWVRTQAFIANMVKRATGASYPAVSERIVLRSRLSFPPLTEQRCMAEILDRAEGLRAKRRASRAQLDTLTQAVFLDLFGDPSGGDRKWPVNSIEEIAANEKHSIVDGPFGSSIKPEDYRESGVPVIRIGNITRDGYFWDQNLLYISRAKFESLKRSRVRANDVLVSRVGTIGNVCIFPEGIGDALLSTTGVCKITPNPERMLSVFLHQALRMPSLQAQIHKSASTSVQKYFNLTALKGWKIIVPPLYLQREFSHHVASIENLKDAQRTSLAEMDSLFASLQHRVFRGDV